MMNLVGEKTAKICCLAIGILVLGLLPLKVWRAHLLKEARIVYYPTKEWSVAISLTVEQTEDLKNKLHGGINYDDLKFDSNQYSKVDPGSWASLTRR